DFLTVNYELCIERPCTKTSAPHLNKQDVEQATRARIAANPLGYLDLTWRHLRSLWAFSSSQHISSKNETFLDELRPLPFEELIPVLGQQPRAQPPLPMAEVLRSVLAVATLCLALFGIICLLTGRVLPQVAVLATTAALGVQGGALLTAMTGIGIPRYFFVLRPFLVTALVCAACWIVSATRPGRPDEIPATSH